jgi:AraC-like DNA-binding protein
LGATITSLKPELQHIVSPLAKCPVFVGCLKGKLSASRLGYHREIELQYIKAGQACYFVSGRKFQLRKNSLLVIRPYEIHRFLPYPDVYVEKYDANFLSPYLTENSRPLRLPADFPRHVRFSENEGDLVSMIFINCIQELTNKEAYWTDLIQKKLMELFFLIKRAGTRPEPPRKENPVITQLVDYLEKNYTQSLPVSFLAQKFGYSNNYLSDLFQQCTGMGIKHYLLHRRILEAKRLIETKPYLKSGIVAEKVGFDNFFLFRRAFKRLTGVTAGEYRRILSQA